MEIQIFLALGALGAVLWGFEILAFFGYRQLLNGHNLGSTNDRRLVLVSNIMFWDELSEKNFENFFWYHNFYNFCNFALFGFFPLSANLQYHGVFLWKARIVAH